MWTLFICLNMTVMGCGFSERLPFQSKTECFEALDHMRFDKSGSIANEQARSSASYCYPASSTTNEQPPSGKRE